MDNYTKFILTVIAVSMFKIAFFEMKTIESAYADNKVHKIAICDKGGYNCADMLTTYGSGDANLLGTYSNQQIISNYFSPTVCGQEIYTTLAMLQGVDALC